VPLEGDHRHCKVCGRVTKPDSETCSAKCASERERRMASAKNTRYLLYGMIAFLVILLLTSFLH